MPFPNDPDTPSGGGRRGAGSVAIAASFPADTLARELEKWFPLLDAPLRVEMLLSQLPHSYLRDARHGVLARSLAIHVVPFRLDDWNNVVPAGAGDEEIHPCSRKLIETNLGLTIDSLENIADKCFATLILVLCPLSPRHRAHPRIIDYFADVERRLRSAIADHPQYAVLNAQDLVSEDRPAAHEDYPTEPYTPLFFARVARRIVQACYAYESRPWRALVVSWESVGAAFPADDWENFVSRQWRAGRRVGLLRKVCQASRQERYGIVDSSIDPLAVRVRRVAGELLVPEQDTVFIGCREECREVAASAPSVLALPIFGLGLDTIAQLDELWCMQPIPDLWFSGMERARPAMPRLPGGLLTELARHPEWDAAAFSKTSS